MHDSAMNEQDRRFCDIMQRIDRLYEKYAKSKGMTYMSMTVLECVVENENDCTQKLICEHTHYPKQSVNLIIRSFWEEGYVTLEELSSDRRNKRIVLTDKGRGYAAETVGGQWDIDRAAALRLSDKQREELLHLLTIYADAYEDGVMRALEQK